MSEHDEHDERDHDEWETDAEEDPDGAEGIASAPRRRLMERLMDAAPTAPAKPSLDRNGNPTKWTIDRLDARERVYSYLAGIMAAFFAVLIYSVESGNPNFHVKKGQFTPDTTLIVGLVCGVVLVLTTYLGRRALVGFVALFTFLGFSSANVVVGLPFLLLAAWLLYRSYKVQKEVTARIKSERASGSTATAASRPSRAEAAEARRAGGRSSRKAKAPTGPEANKRYTPKKPVRPPPPPPKASWRERRAAGTTD